MKHPGHQLGICSLQCTLNGTKNAARAKVLAGGGRHHGKKKPSRYVLNAETRGSHPVKNGALPHIASMLAFLPEGYSLTITPGSPTSPGSTRE